MPNTIHRARQTKIVATLGPASETAEMIEKLVREGVDVFRLNFSHGTHADHKARLDTIRAIETKLNRPISIMADMQGPKLRVGKFKNGSIALEAGMIFRLDLSTEEGDETRVNLPHPEIIDAMIVGEDLLMDDGKVRMTITEKGSDYLIAIVKAGVKLSNNKGVNVPGVVLPIAALTPKDLKDLDAALDMGVDWIAQSFVQTPDDVQMAKDIIKGRAGLIIKIEKPAALNHLVEMIDLADAVMLARGDLGVEIPPENVPAVQKHVVRAAREAGKPIIVATQMLESMIDNPAPTRAEASDVATAVYDGADAVMLSAETAAGKYPIEAVSIMNRICIRTEGDETYRNAMDMMPMETNSQIADSITAAAWLVAEDVSAAAIVNYTSMGLTTIRTARQRPPMPIISLTPSRHVARKLMLSYGVSAFVVENVDNLDGSLKVACDLVRNAGLVKVGEHIVITAGVPFGIVGTTNLLRVEKICA